MTNEELVKQSLDVLSKFTYYGAFYKGKLLDVSNCRIYVQTHRAKTELISRLSQIYDQKSRTLKHLTLNDRKQIVDDLIKSGEIEIKEI